MSPGSKGGVSQATTVLCVPDFVLCCLKKLVTCHIFTMVSESS